MEGGESESDTYADMELAADRSLKIDTRLWTTKSESYNKSQKG